MERVAHITGGADSLAQVQAYLPSNYTATVEPPCPYCGEEVCRGTALTANGADLERFERIHPHRSTRTIVIRGTDNAGWTLDGYVIPRLASGLIWAREETQH